MLIRLHINLYLNLSLLPLKVISKNIPSPYNIAPHIHQGRTVNQGYDHKLNKPLVAKQPLLVSTIGNV